MTSGPEPPWWAKPGGAPPPQPPAGRPPSRQPRPPARPDPHGVAHRRQHAGPHRPPPPGAPPPTDRTPPPTPSRRRRYYVIVAAVAVVAVLAVGLSVWKLQSSGGTRLDVHQAEAGVAEILSNPIHGYGANDVAAVACNNGKNPVIRVGATFTCAVDINGTLRHVAVEITDDSGTYAVDGPR